MQQHAIQTDASSIQHNHNSNQPVILRVANKQMQRDREKETREKQIEMKI
jgi:hypothetical protein